MTFGRPPNGRRKRLRPLARSRQSLPVPAKFGNDPDPADQLSTLALSGANHLDPTFVLPGAKSLNSVYNAGVKGRAQAFEAFFADVETGAAAARAFVRDTVGDIPRADVVILNEDEMCELGDALVTLASHSAVRQYDLAIFPRRGGHKLRLILEGMLATHCPFRDVEFSGAASQPNDLVYTEFLRQAVEGVNPGSQLFRIAVVDVGDRGDGTQKMLQLLRELRGRRFPRQHWSVEFNVFHAHDHPERFTRLEGVYGLLAATVETYCTNTDLLDDWIAAIGLEKVPRAVPGTTVLVPLAKEVVRPAAIILKSSRGYRVTASPIGFHAANLVISRFSTESLTTSPIYRRAPELDRW